MLSAVCECLIINATKIMHSLREAMCASLLYVSKW